MTDRVEQLSKQAMDTIIESLILYMKWNEGFSKVAVTQNDYEASARHIINANNAERALAELEQKENNQ
jgi:hypothetical protein